VQKLLGYLRLTRPANVVTAVSDILAGIAIAGYFNKAGIYSFSLSPVILLAIATIGLYGGGVVFNDVFDAELDKVERPERPIPSGLVPKKGAAMFALLLLLAGIVAAAMVHKSLVNITTFLAIAIALASVVYDKWGKHHYFLGPVNMGLCRGLNLLLGMSILPEVLQQYWFLGFIPVLYIAAITMISRGEVHGGSKSTLYGAAFLYIVVLLALFLFSFNKGNLLLALLFIIAFAVMIFSPLLKAIQDPIGPRIGKAVKLGVLALILMNAAWAAAFGAPLVAIGILVLLPISILLARLFAVT
jgi:4-hydroxybenzoate polyprenyltransferase